MSVKYTSEVIVWFVIKGEAPSRPPPGLIHQRDDGGLCRRLFQWLNAHDIVPAVVSRTGGGCWIGGFHPIDGPRVKEWLDQNGAEEELPWAESVGAP